MSTRKQFQKFTSKQIDELYEQHRQTPNLTNQQLAEWAFDKFNFPEKPHRSSIGRALKRKQQECENDDGRVSISKKQQAGRFPDVEQAVYMWITERQSRNIPLSWELITTSALDFANRFGHGDKEFKASNGWQDRFRRRFDIGELNIHGEFSSDTTRSAAVATTVADENQSDHPSLMTNDEIVKLVRREHVPEVQEHGLDEVSPPNVAVSDDSDDTEETSIPMPVQDKVYYLTRVIEILDSDEVSETRRQLIKIRRMLRAHLNSRQS